MLENQASDCDLVQGYSFHFSSLLHLDIGLRVKRARLKAFGDSRLIEEVKTLTADGLFPSIYRNRWIVIRIDRDHLSHPKLFTASARDHHKHEAGHYFTFG
jgi:hypothetical protein